MKDDQDRSATRKFLAVPGRNTVEDGASASNEVTSFMPLKDQQALSARKADGVKISRQHLVSLIQTQKTAEKENRTTRARAGAQSAARSTNSDAKRAVQRQGSVTRSQNRNGNLLHLKLAGEEETPSKPFFIPSTSQRKETQSEFQLKYDASPQPGAFMLLLPSALQFGAPASATAQHGQ